MGPVQLFVFLAAVSGAFGSDESLKLKPWIPKFQDALNALKLSKESRFFMKPINESWGNLGSSDSAKLIMEKDALGCGSYSLSPGQTINIQSTDFPDSYPENDACTWTFEASSNSTISINCTIFKLKNCMFSTLKITGGDLDKIFCGNMEDGIQESSSNNQMEVVFKSKMITGQGFQCTVSASGTTQETRSCIQCGTVNRRTRIINGYYAQVNEFPWQAALVNATTTTIFCGGVVYNDLYILTAAHCVTPMYQGLIAEVLLGAYNLASLTSNVQRIAVGNAYIDNNYDPITAEYDFGLILLATPAIFNDFVRPACLPYNDYTNNYAVTSGWGLTKAGGSTSNYLLKGYLWITEYYNCNGYYKTPVTQNMICTHYLTYYPSTICSGDSGGPLIVYDNGIGVVVGITSFNDANCTIGAPAVFTRVSLYTNFLTTLSDSGYNNLCY